MIAAALVITLDNIFYDEAALLRLHKSFTYVELLANCTVSEKAIIGDMVLALKKSLKNLCSAGINGVLAVLFVPRFPKKSSVVVAFGNLAILRPIH